MTDIPGFDLVPQEKVRVKGITFDTMTLGFNQGLPLIII